MRGMILAFLCGVLSCQFLPVLPSLPGLLLLLLLPFLFARFVWLRLMAALILGFLWAVLRAGWVLQTALPVELEGRDVVVEGQIISIPHYEENRIRFRFEPQQFRSQGKEWPSPGILSLTAYDYGKSSPNFRAGQYWRFSVRLKRPRHLANPGAFDYSAWLFRRHVRATGYIRLGKKPVELLAAAPAWYLHTLRQNLWEKLMHGLGDSNHAGMIAALALGVKQDISDEQWNILRRTGTVHLMAISGLHITLLAGMSAWLARYLWRFGGSLMLYVPAPRFAGLCGLIISLVYTLLAGFSIPTQRAFIMIAVALGGLLLGFRSAPSHSLALAMALVLLWEPAAVMAPGFWLSFAAVAVILYGLSGRLKPNVPWLRIHFLVLLGLAPLLLVCFGQIPLLSPLANLVAVPCVGLAVVPLTLLGTALLGLWQAGAEFLLQAAARILEWLWVFLRALDNGDAGIWQFPGIPLWTLFFAIGGVFILLLPRGFPARSMGILWLLPALFYPQTKLPAGTFRVTQLDVGQGNAVVVQTHGHTLVYDSGPRFSRSFDAGSGVIAPFLRYRGIRQIDTLLISHGDNDHAGGTEGLLKNMKVQHVAGSHLALPGKPEVCFAGQHWHWDGVDFQILHPPAGVEYRKNNNRSCVLKVNAGGHSLLLAGDIEKDVERELVKKYVGGLKSDILSVPHHGSLTSSAEIFVKTVAAKFALFSTGYRNRFGFPKAEVVQRYRENGTTVLNTAESGAIEFSVSAQAVSAPRLFRPEAQRYWH